MRDALAILQNRCAALETENEQLRSRLEAQNTTQLRLEMAMRASKQGFWHWHVETNETFYSNEYYQILGYESNAFKPSYEHWVSLLHPEDLAKTVEAQACFVKGEIPEYNITCRLLTKSGEYRWFLTKAGKIQVGKDKLVLTGLVIDIHEHKQAELALVEQEARLNFALEVADLGIWDWNLEKGSYYHTPNYFKLLGFEANEIAPSYEYWVSSLHPEDHDRVVRLEMDCVAGSLRDYHTEYRMYTKQGIYKWFFCATNVLKQDENGQALHMIGIVKDIDQAKKNEIALKESEEKFRLLIEHNAAAVCIFDTERYYYVNPRFLKTFGYDEVTIKTLSPSEIVHHDVEVSMNASHKTTGKYNRYELKSITKTGKTCWVDVTTLPIYYQDKNVNIATMYDITTRRQFEMEIKEKNEELLASEEELRQNAEELTAMNETLEVAKTQLEQLLVTQQEINLKVERKNWDLYNQKKEIKHTLKQLRDTQEHLIQSEKMASLGVLVAGIAHEINNPINYISTSAEGLQYNIEDILTILNKYAEVDTQNTQAKLSEIIQLKKKLDFDELIAEVPVLLDNIQSGTKQTAEIVRGLRIFSRVEGGNLEAVEVHQTLDNALLILNNEYKYSIDIEKVYNPTPLYAEALTSKLGQVFVNILKNAMDAIKTNDTQEKGNIKITTYTSVLQEITMIVTEIEDNGGGIPENVRKHIFEPFFTTKDVGQGTGLGLSISLGIIENFGGKIIVDSIIGKGTKFIVYLPQVKS